MRRLSQSELIVESDKLPYLVALTLKFRDLGPRRIEIANGVPGDPELICIKLHIVRL